VDDDELTPEDADARDLAALEEAVEKPEKRRAAPGDEDEEDPEDYLVEVDEGRQPRRERRNERYDSQTRRVDELEQELRLLRSQQPMQQPMQHQGPTPEQVANGVKAQLRKFYDDEIGLETHARLLAEKGELTAEARDALLDRKASIEMERATLNADYAQYKSRISQPPPQNPAVTHLQQRYYKVLTKPSAASAARTYYLEQVESGRLRDGRTQDIELYEESLQMAQAKIEGRTFTRGQAERPRPDASSRARFSGSSGSGGAPAGARPKQVIKISKAEEEMAHAWGEHIKDPKERLKRYHKEVLVPMRAKEQAAERRRA